MSDGTGLTSILEDDAERAQPDFEIEVKALRSLIMHLWSRKLRLCQKGTSSALPSVDARVNHAKIMGLLGSPL